MSGGRSKPNCLRNRIAASGLVESGEKVMRVTGSPGARIINMNEKNVIPKNVGTAWISRRITKTPNSVS